MSLRDSAHLVTAAGIDFRTLDPMDCYLLAGKIISDRELTEACRPQFAVLPKGIRAKVLQNWPETKRAALRERIGATR